MNIHSWKIRNTVQAPSDYGYAASLFIFQSEISRIMQDPKKRSDEHSSHTSSTSKSMGCNHSNAPVQIVELQHIQRSETNKASYKVDISKVKNLHELSCDMLSLSFLEQEDEIYTLNDLREMY